MLLGKQAPLFEAPAVIGDKIEENFSLEQYKDKKYVLLFFYPADFSGLCPTEILAFQERLNDFEQEDVQIVGCSVDSKFAHQKWLQTPVSEGGIHGVTYPMVSDATMAISMSYHVLAGCYAVKNDCCNTKDDSCCDSKKDSSCCEANKEHCCGCGYVFKGIPMSYRATILIDKSGKVRHYSVNEFAMGRDVEEYLRLIRGIKLIDETGGACPANWRPEKK